MRGCGQEERGRGREERAWPGPEGVVMKRAWPGREGVARARGCGQGERAWPGREGGEGWSFKSQNYFLGKRHIKMRDFQATLSNSLFPA